MATSHKDLEGWQVITTDEHGNITTGSRRRSRKGGSVENVYVQRIADGLSFGRGNSVVMHDEVTKTYSIYLIHEIRQNTLNNVIEIWAFSYLRWFELNAKKYYTQFDPTMLTKGLAKDALKENLFKEINPNEIYLTAELSEIWLKDFIDVATVWTKDEYEATPTAQLVNDKDFYVRYICEPTAESFVAIDIHKETKKIKLMEPKTSEEHLKKMTAPSFMKGFKKPGLSSSSSTPRKVPRMKEIKVEAGDSSFESTPLRQSRPRESVVEIPSETETAPVLSEQTNKNVGAEDHTKDSSEENFTSASEHIPEEEEVESASSSSSSSSSEDEFGIVPSPNNSSQSEGEEEDVAMDSDDDDEDDEVLQKAHRKRKALRKELYGPERKERKVSRSQESDDESKEPNKNKKAIFHSSSSSDEEKEKPRGEDSSSEEDIPLSQKKASYTTVKSPKPSDTTSQRSLESGDSSNKNEKSANHDIKTAKEEDKRTKGNLQRLQNKYMQLKSKFNVSSSSRDSTTQSRLSLVNNGQAGSKPLDIAALESKIRPSITKDKRTTTIFSKLKSKKNINDDKSIIEVIQDFVALPARSKEFARCYLEIFDSLRKNESKALYINGRSGSGKTSIVKKLLGELTKSSDYKELSLFKTIFLNKKSVGEDIYKYVWDRISGDKAAEESLSSSAAERSLEFFFTSVDRNRKRHTVVVLDDIDILNNEDTDLLYNFFHWTTFPNSKLIVIAIGQNPDLIKQNLGKHVLASINYHNIPFDNYSSEEIFNIVQYRLKTLKKNYNFKVMQVKGTDNLVFDKLTSSDLKNRRKNKSQTEWRIVNVFMDDAKVEEAARDICLTNNDAQSAIRIIDNACEYTMKEYIAIQSTIMKRNKGLAVSNLPGSQEINLQSILKSLSQKSDLLVIDLVNKVSYIEKLFLYGCMLCSRENKSVIVETEDIYNRMTSLVNNNRNNKFIRNILHVLAPSVGYSVASGGNNAKEEKYSRDLFEMINWNKIIMNMVSLQFLVIVKQDDKNVNHINTIKMKIPLSDLESGLDISLIV